MSKLKAMGKNLLVLAATVSVAGWAHAQSNDFATGNMHFDAQEMDTNGDHMIQFKYI